MDKVENIGLIGYGVIGKAIAKELMKSYYHVFVYDNSESEMILAKKQGCFTCISPQDVSLKTKITLGDQAFACAAPKVWNDLPLIRRKSSTLTFFKSKLKTYQIV